MKTNDKIDKNYNITKKNITDKKFIVYSFVTYVDIHTQWQ